MLKLLRKLIGTVGSQGTLKRETVVVIWFWLTFIIVRVYVFADPAQVQNFEDVNSTIVWALILLLAAIFGLQIVPPWLAGGQPGKSTIVETDDTRVETRVDPVPAEEQKQ